MKKVLENIFIFLEKDIVRNILSIIALFLYFLCAYNTSVIDYIYPNDKFLVLSLMASVFIFFILYLKNIKEKMPITTKTLLACFIVFVIIIFNNRDLAYGNFGLPFFYIVNIAMFYVLCNNNDWNKIAIKFLQIFTIEHTLCTWLFFVMPEFYQTYVMPIFPEMYQQDLMYQFKNKQMAGLTYHYSTNGMYLALGTIIFLGGVLKNKDKKSKIIELIFCVLTFGALLLTGKRGHLLFVIVTIFAMTLINGRKNIKRYLKSMILVLGICGIVFLGLVQVIPALNNTFERFAEFANSADITNGRLPFYKLAIEKFMDKPLFGNGWGSYKHIFQQSDITVNYQKMDTHNIYLQLLCENGIIKTAIFLGILLYVFIVTFKLLLDEKISQEENKFLMISFGIQSFVLLYGLTGNSIYDIQIFFQYTIALAITYSIRNKYLSEKIEKNSNLILEQKNKNGKRIGILTFQNTTNYGAELQKYALQQYIDKKGHISEIIDYKCDAVEKRELPMNILNQRSIKRIIKSVFMSDLQYIRYNKFRNFANKYVNTSKKEYDEKNKSELNSIYDMFVVGSDQIWNMTLTNGDTTYMLDFVDDDSKKNSYAASFGYSKIPEEHYEVSKNLISKFNKINVREIAGKEITEEFVKDKIVDVTMDPTFLLEQKDWETLIEDKPLYEEDYILVYMPYKSKEVFEYIYDLAKKENCKIVYIHGSLKTKIGMINLRDASPIDFLNLVKNAKFIVSGSFHAVCFSLIFKKQFFYTVSMDKKFNSRIAYLIELTNLQNRKVEKNTYSKIENIDYNKVNKLLEEKIKNSKEILNKMLGEENE